MKPMAAQKKQRAGLSVKAKAATTKKSGKRLVVAAGSGSRVYGTMVPALRSIHRMESAAREISLIDSWVTAHAPLDEIEEITVLATSVLEDRDKAIQWLSRPNLATDNRPPIELIGEKNGLERVKNLLMRIEYGVLT